MRRYLRRSETNGAGQQHLFGVSVINKKPLGERISRIDAQEQNCIKVKDIIKNICKEEQINPNNCKLFGICLDRSGNHFLPSTKVINLEVLRKKNLYFRLQYRAVDCTKLQKDDENAFKYYLLQCRNDFINGRFKKNLNKLQTHSEKQEVLLRMVILEMILMSKDETQTLPNKQFSLQQIFRQRQPYSVESILSEYVDQREEVKRCRKIIEKSLQEFHNVKDAGYDFVREIVLLPNYHRETIGNLWKVYSAGESTCREKIWMTVHPSEGLARVRCFEDSFKKVDDRIPFDNLSSLAMRQAEDNEAAPKYQLIIGRKDDSVEVIFSDSECDLDCLCSWIDGYYQLFVNQYDSLLEPRSVIPLFHGPIERNVAENLMKRYEATEGDFLIREDRKSYDGYVLTRRSSTALTHMKINSKIKDETKAYYIQDENFFPSLQDLIKHYQNETVEGYMLLKRNIKPAGPMPFLSNLNAVSSNIKPAVVSPHKGVISWIDSSSLIELEKLPKGLFGNTSVCKQRFETHAEKVFVRTFTSGDISKRAFERIAKCYRGMSNRLIVRMTGISPSDDDIKLMAFEYMEQGPLDEYLSKNRDTVKYGMILKYMNNVAEGMMYLEKTMKIVHGNLKIHNVLLMENGNLKIADACFDWVLQQEGELTKTALIASCNWRAPEVLAGEMLTSPSDVWSFGMLLWDMMSLCKPVGSIDKNKLLESLSEEQQGTQDLLPYCSECIRDILAQCWKDDPLQRSHFEEIFHQLDSYRRGVATHLKERCYYKWKQIEKQDLEDVRRDRQRKANLFSKMAASSSSASSGKLSSVSAGSSDSENYHRVRINQQDSVSESSRTTSTDPNALEVAENLKWTSSEALESCAAILVDDIEMIDVAAAGPAGQYKPTNTELFQTTSFDNLRVCAKEESADNMMMDVDYIPETRPSESITSCATENSAVQSMEVNTSQFQNAPTNSVILSRFGSVEENLEENKPTADMIEIANVLASMASQRGSDKERPRLSQSGFFQSQTAKTSPKNNPLVIKNQPIRPKTSFVKKSDANSIGSSCNSPVDEAAMSFPASPFSSSSGSTSKHLQTTGSNSSSGEKFTYHSVDDIHQFKLDRKKRSNSLSEQASKVQKKAAKRALDRPNPFNIGTNVPRNFLMKRKETSLPTTVNNPYEISNYFRDIAGAPILSGNTAEQNVKDTDTNLLSHILENLQEDKQPQEQPYKTMPEIQAMREKLSSLKAGATGSASNVKPSTEVKQSQPASIYATYQSNADPNTVQAAVNAYFTQLVGQGHSIVAGNPVFIPQAAVSSNLNQSAASIPQLLHLLQAHQKLSQASASPIVPPNRPIDASLQITPNYLQAILTLMASKNLVNPTVNVSQLSQAISTNTVVASSLALTNNTTVASNVPLSKDVQKKIIDIKPKVTGNFVDLTKSENEAVMDNLNSKNTSDQSKGYQGSGVNASLPKDTLRSLTDNKNQTPRPRFVAATPASRPPLIDTKTSASRPFIVRASTSSHPVRLQPLILPKTVAEQKGRAGQQQWGGVQLPGQTNQMATRSKLEAKIASDNLTRNPVNRIKTEPQSPVATIPAPELSSKGLYRSLPQALSPVVTVAPIEKSPLTAGKIREFSEALSQIPKRRKSDESTNILAEIGNLNVFKNEDLRFEKKLGEGQFGEVWKAGLRCKGRTGAIELHPVAVKKLKNNEESVIQQFKNEVKQLAALNNEYIVKLIGVSVDPKGDAEGPWIITELMTGSLNQFIVGYRPTINEDSLLNFAVQIAKGMEYLQSCRIVHRDLATRNVLVQSRDRVKVSDFGLSRMFEDKDYYRAKRPSMLPIRWYAMESIRDMLFTSESDVWSYGVTLWEMFMLLGSKDQYATPYGHIKGADACKKILEFIEEGNRLEKPERCSKEIWDLISRCWKKNPDERLSFYLLSMEIGHFIRRQ